MRKIRIALSQINPTVGALSKNSKKILDFVKRAENEKADIVVFPELALCGYPPQDLLFKNTFLKDHFKILKKLEKKVGKIVVILGCVDRDKKGNIYNSAAIIFNKKIVSFYHKMDLFNYGVFDEKRYFQPGRKINVFKIGEIIFGVNIFEDIFPDKVAKEQKNKGAKLILNLCASHYCVRKNYLRKKIIKEKAKKLNLYIAFANLVGGQDELVFDGASFIVDPKGKEIIEAKQFEEDLILCDLFLKESKVKKHKNIINLGQLKKEKKPPLIKRKKEKSFSQWQEIYQALVLGTRDYVLKNGFKKVVIGLSGGIDSCLTCAIACDALGNENVIGVSMPSKYSSLEGQKDVEKLAKNLKIKLLKIGIDKIFSIYLQTLKKEFKNLKPDVTEENLQARIRGNILMALSNKFGWLVLSTGNKSEIFCGYCTLYGDMVGGLDVLKDVYKTWVYKLAEFRNQKKQIIPLSVFKRAPSAELKPNQKDQDVLPPYPILDKILKAYIQENKSYKEIAREKKIDKKVIKKVIEMVDKNEYKKRQLPPGIKITLLTFEKERKMPLTNQYKEF